MLKSFGTQSCRRYATDWNYLAFLRQWTLFAFQIHVWTYGKSFRLAYYGNSTRNELRSLRSNTVIHEHYMSFLAYFSLLDTVGHALYSKIKHYFYASTVTSSSLSSSCVHNKSFILNKWLWTYLFGGKKPNILPIFCGPFFAIVHCVLFIHIRDGNDKSHGIQMERFRVEN